MSSSRMTTAFEIGGLKVQPGERAFHRLPVTSLLIGSDLTLPLHVIHGAKPGPVLGIVALVHGSEYVHLRSVANVLKAVDPQELAGTIVAIPVANPVAFGNRTRSTPEIGADTVNLNRVFPGGTGAMEHGAGRFPTDRSLTERMAEVIYNEFLPKINYLIDFHHCTEPIIYRFAIFKEQQGGVGEESRAMARAMGLGIINKMEGGRHRGSLYNAGEELGIPTVLPEIGGGFLPKPIDDRIVNLCVRGVQNVMKHLKMVSGEIEIPERQVIVTRRAVSRPPRAGYLLSDIDAEDFMPANGDVLEVKKGQRVGVMLDPYTLEKKEELFAEADGYPLGVRRTGLTETGERGTEIGIKELAEWID